MLISRYKSCIRDDMSFLASEAMVFVTRVISCARPCRRIIGLAASHFKVVRPFRYFLMYLKAPSPGSQFPCSGEMSRAVTAMLTHPEV